ncbi:phage tail tape measure protein [Psychrobacter pygoscelis]|uniref:phage tail tape measure protein n=1 Tax=Psychrobacter pygoscelis TaxID=2488563 RepID=UPI00103F3AB0|nr:phage tail tape measure protein [Psychrobacter pygoscelis]
MSTNTVVLRLLLRGNAGRELTRIANQQRRDTRTINDMQRLGLRTQRQVRDEIRNQERAYRRLRASANATSNDIRRAHRAMRQEVRRLNDELRTSDRLTSRMGNVGAVAGGVAAGAMVLQSQIHPARTYDEKLARTAGTATYGQDMTVAERKLVKIELGNSVKEAVRQGGGTRDGAIEAAQRLIGSGEYDMASVKAVLGATQRASFVSEASPIDAASVTLQLKNFGISEEDIAQGQDIAVAGGQLGGFEYNTMARYLSQQLPLAKAAGYGGLEGFKKIVAMNQVAMRTAGTEDEAGNNVVNLLQKLNSNEFSRSIKKNITPRPGDPKTVKGGGLDWAAYAQIQKAKGVDQVDAFVKLLERELEGNSQYQSLKSQADNASGKEAQALYEQMTQMMQGTNLGNIIADRQALMAALAVSSSGDENKRIKSGLDNASGTVNDFYELFKDDEWATARQRQQEQLNINYNLYKDVNGALSTFNSEMAGFMQNHEELSKAAYGAGVALASIAAMGTVGSLMGGGGLGGGRLGAGAARAGGKVAAVAATAYVGYKAGNWVSDKLDETPIGDKIQRAITNTMAAFGHDGAQELQAANEKYDQMIAEQQEAKAKQEQMINEQAQTNQIQSQVVAQQAQMIGQLQTIAAKPPPTVTVHPPRITIGGRAVAMNIMDEISKKTKRGQFGPYK